MSQAEVFICYSRKDKKWKEHVASFMQIMKMAGRFDYEAWHDSKIELGKNWESAIDEAINNAKVALLLISPDFLQSEFILKHEVPLFEERRQKGEMEIIPLLVRPCPWEIFDWLNPIQGYLDEELAFSGCTEHQIEVILKRLATEIARIVDNMSVTKEAEVEEEAIAEAEEEETVVSGEPETPGKSKPLKDPAGFLTMAGVFDLIEHSSQNPNHLRTIGSTCIFRTKKQRTWFAVTSSHLYCVLDDEKTAAGGRRIQWIMPLGDADPVNVRDRPGKATGLVDVGRRRNWLYSKRLHPSPSVMKANIEKLIEAGKRS